MNVDVSVIRSGSHGILRIRPQYYTWDPSPHLDLFGRPVSYGFLTEDERCLTELRVRMPSGIMSMPLHGEDGNGLRCDICNAVLSDREQHLAEQLEPDLIQCDDCTQRTEDEAAGYLDWDDYDYV